MHKKVFKLTTIATAKLRFARRFQTWSATNRNVMKKKNIYIYQNFIFTCIATLQVLPKSSFTPKNSSALMTKFDL